MANVKITDFVEQSTLDAGDFLHVKKEGLPDRKISKENLISEALEPLAAADSAKIVGGVPAKGIQINVDSIKGLSLAPQLNGRQYRVLSFYPDIDGGGGLCVFDSSVDKSLHDGATIVDPDRVLAWDGTLEDLSTLFSVGAGSGCFVFKEKIASKKLSVLDFGAKPDQQSHVAIQQALDSVVGLDKEITGEGLRFLVNMDCFIGELTTFSDIELDWDGVNWSNSTRPNSGYTAFVRGGAGGSALLTDNDYLRGIKAKNVKVLMEFLGNPDTSDIINDAMYQSPTQYGICLAGVYEPEIIGCETTGFATSGIGCDGAVRPKYRKNKVDIVRFHGIANQGGHLASLSPSCELNEIGRCGIFAFDTNTRAGSAATWSRNNVRGAAGLGKATDGKIISRNNIVDIIDYNAASSGTIIQLYGNNAGLDAVGDVVNGNAARFCDVATDTVTSLLSCNLASTDLRGAFALGDNCSLTVSGGHIDAMMNSADVKFFARIAGATGVGLDLTFNPSMFSFDTFAQSNLDTRGNFWAAGSYSESTIVVSVPVFKINAQPNHRFFSGAASWLTSAATNKALFTGNNLVHTSAVSNAYFLANGFHHTTFVDNSQRGSPFNIYESVIGATVNLFQDNNYSDVAKLGGVNHIPNGYQRRALPTSATNLESGSLYNNAGTPTIVP